MSLIAVTQRVTTQRATAERRDALDQRWARFLLACDLVPVVVPNNIELARRVLDRIPVRGVLLTGGNDLATYGGDAPERDETETYLLANARLRGLPVLGVCRGMQVIQHAFGVPLRRVEGHVAVRHQTTVHGGTRDVNSFHCLGATTTVPELEVQALAPDGIIEAIRHRTQRVAGLMWHPEREDSFVAHDVDYVSNFFRNGA